MARYVSETRRASPVPRSGEYWPDPQALPQPTVSEAAPTDTGLLDADGNRIMRLPDQIGFIRQPTKRG